MFLGQDNVRLLISGGSDESVNSLDLDGVHLLGRLSDGVFVSLPVNDEHKGVVVFDGLDSALSAEGVANDGVLVPGGLGFITTCDSFG